MTLDDLNNILALKDGDLILEAKAFRSSSVEPLFQAFWGDTSVVIQSPTAKPSTFPYEGQDRKAVHVTGTLGSGFLGCTNLTFDANFFLLDEAAHVVITLTDPSNYPRKLSSLFAQAQGSGRQGANFDDEEVPIFQQCVFTLDSKRPYSLGKEFDAPFQSGGATSQGKEGAEPTTALHLTAQVQLSEVDEMLCDCLGEKKTLTVAGPVELTEHGPRMRLATDDEGLESKCPVISFSLPDPMPKLNLEMHYQFLAAPSATGTIVIREQLKTTFTYEHDAKKLPIPLYATFEPNSLTERLCIESFNQDLPLTLDVLTSLIPGDIKAAIPKNIPVLNNLKLTNLSFEVSTGPLELRAVGVRVEVSKNEGGWAVVPDLLIFKGLALDISVIRDLEGWQIYPFYITGTLELAGGILDVGADVGAETVFCLLKEDTKISLKNLFEALGQELKALPSDLPKGEGDVAIDHLEIWATLDGTMVTFDIGTQITWPLLDGKIKIESLFFSLEYEKGDDSPGVTLGGSLSIAGVLIEMVGRSSDGGWEFTGRTGQDQQIEIGTLIEEGVHLFDPQAQRPAALDGFTIENLGVSFNTATKAFAFTCKGNIPVGDGGPILSCTVEIKIDGQNEKATFGGILIVGGAEFTLKFESSKEGKELAATWEYKEDSPRLDLTTIGDGLPDLSALGDRDWLIPKSAQLTLMLSENEKRLSLACTIDTITAAFLLVSRRTPPATIVAFGLKPPNISTEDLGPLGKALDPHHIALNDLVIVVANDTLKPEADGSNLKLGEKAYPISKGLFLQGALEFKQTSFSYPFECRLGGDKPTEQAKALPEMGAGGSVSPTTEREEGKNNAKVGRTIGPVTFRKVRFESREESGEKRVYVLLDASFGSGGFELDLIGFNLNFPLKLPLELVKEPGKITEIGVGLDGLSIAYSNPPLTVCGGFARTKAEKPYVDYLYEGHLLIKAELFQIAVVGSYGSIEINPATKETKPSLFIYGAYVGAVGGPPAFFVNGLALGGGYNTRLVIPSVEKVAEFPLVTAVTDPAKFKMETLRTTVLPSYGDYWLAIGVKFTSFKMADSFALFSIAFGNRLQFALLGLTKVAVPPGAKAGKCVVNAELAIRAVLDPDAGIFSIEGRLTENSFIFAKEIRLTGGFAFFVWFGNAKEAGDFVISLGGYHPEFLPPPHYPVVPRVGIRAQLSDALIIVGEVYLALTPSCLMAGIKLAAAFETDILTATFVAYADFLVAWAPFYYDARIGMGIAVTIRLARTYKLEVSANLHVWGPPFAGTASVTLFIVSFTVEFGDPGGAQPPPLKWDEFQKAFLPPPPEPKKETTGSEVEGGVTRTDEYYAVLNTIRITEGLVREVKKAESKDGKEIEVTYRIVNPHELMIETDSAIPCSNLRMGTKEKTIDAGQLKLGIRPMAVTNFTSSHTVSIIKIEGQRSVEEKFTARWSHKNFPVALWSANEASSKPEVESMVEDVPAGVVLRVQPKAPEYCLGPFLIEQFAYELIQKKIRWKTAPAADTGHGGEFTTVLKENPPLRSQIRDCLVRRVAKQRVAEPEKSWWNEIAMQNTSDNPRDHFQALPTCAALGQRL